MERKPQDTNENMANRPVSKDIESKKGGIMDKAGEAIEHAGQKISDMGAEKVGKAIHDLGDKMEKTHSDSER